MNKPQVREESQSLYDVDFFEWTQTVAENLRHGRVSPTDLEYIAEEIADMGKRDRREMRSRAIVLIAHLLKWLSSRSAGTLPPGSIPSTSNDVNLR